MPKPALCELDVVWLSNGLTLTNTDRCSFRGEQGWFVLDCGAREEVWFKDREVAAWWYDACNCEPKPVYCPVVVPPDPDDPNAPEEPVPEPTIVLGLAFGILLLAVLKRWRHA